MIKFTEEITGEILFKRVLQKTLNTPMAGVVSMMYLFSVITVVYDVALNGTQAFYNNKWALFAIFFIPMIMISSFKTIRERIYNKLKKDEKLVIEYDISTWYIEVKDWDDRTIKWSEVYRFEETKKSVEFYLNPTQSITIDKNAISYEDLIDLKELALTKLGKRKVKILK